MLVPAEVASFAVDPATGEPLLVLKAVDSNRTVSIPVEPEEATSIAVKSLDVSPHQPFTIDIVLALVEALGGIIDKAEIYAQSQPYHKARLYIVVGLAVHCIECRPSDAVALALRCGCMVVVDDEVFEKATGKDAKAQQTGLGEQIARIDTIDFGRYYLK